MKKLQRLAAKISLTKREKRKYVMSTDQDYEILSKIKQLGKCDLNKQEKLLIRLIRTQLERDWRKWLIKELDKILRSQK